MAADRVSFPESTGIIPLQPPRLCQMEQLAEEEQRNSQSQQRGLKRPVKALLTKLIPRTGYYGGEQPICLGCCHPLSHHG